MQQESLIYIILNDFSNLNSIIIYHSKFNHEYLNLSHFLLNMEDVSMLNQFYFDLHFSMQVHNHINFLQQ